MNSLVDDVGVDGLGLCLSFVVAGIPALLLKRLAGSFFAKGDRVLFWRSVRWSIAVGVAVFLLHLAVTKAMVHHPSLRSHVIALGGLIWTATGFAILCLFSVGMDYWKAVRPRSTQLSTAAIIGFLLVSNLWVLPGGMLIRSFNTITLFPSCFDTRTGEWVSTLYQARPEGCQAD
jgi:hypothetical protein